MYIFIAHTVYKTMIYISYISNYFMNYSKSLEIASVIPISNQLKYLSKLLPQKRHF